MSISEPKTIRPSRMPKPAEGVIFCYSDSDLIGSEIMQIPMVVTSVHPSGAINGYLILDPAAVVQGKDGVPETVMQKMVSDKSFVPFTPVQAAPYGHGTKNTWHFAEERFNRVAPGAMLNAIKSATKH